MWLRNIFQRFGTLILIVLAVLATLFITKCSSCSNTNDTALLDSTIIDLQNDSLTFYRNQHGEQIAKITTLQGYVAGFLEANFEKDSTLKSLQKTVGEYKKRLVTATALLEKANARATVANIDICDTLFLASTDTIFLVADEWADVSVTPNEDKDSLEVDIELRNEIHLWHQYGKRPGLFKPRPLVVFALQKSPYFETTEIKSLVVPPPPKKKRKWIRNVAIALVPIVGTIIIAEKNK